MALQWKLEILDIDFRFTHIRYQISVDFRRFNIILENAAAVSRYGWFGVPDVNCQMFMG
jgi:hypothetical protein